MSSPAFLQNLKAAPSIHLKAVLTILEADEDFRVSILPFIDLERESIDWEGIYRIPFGSGHTTMVSWLYIVWTDEQRPNSNVFSGSFNVPARVQAAILKALAIRWGFAV